MGPDIDTYLEPAFRHVLAGTTIKPALQDRLFPAWASAYMSGDPKEEKRCLNELRRSDWVWPLLDIWIRRFEAKGAWPYMWKLIGVNDLTAQRADAMTELLQHYLFTSACSSRDGKKLALYLARNGWRIVGSGCPVEEIVAAELASTVSLEDWRTWPPFFPGDRSSLMAAPNRRDAADSQKLTPALKAKVTDFRQI